MRAVPIFDGNMMEAMSSHCRRILCHGSRIPVSKTTSVHLLHMTFKDRRNFTKSFIDANVAVSPESVLRSDNARGKYAKKRRFDWQAGRHSQNKTSSATKKYCSPHRAPSAAAQNVCSVSEVDDDLYMRMALAEAAIGASVGEVPVGAVLVQNRAVIASAHNRVEMDQDPTAHAEMLCIRTAATRFSAWRLPDCTLYVTLEPCAMCAGAVLQARVGRIVWGAPNTLLGADGSWVRLFPTSNKSEEPSHKDEKCDCSLGPIHPFHPHIQVHRGVLEKECAKLMRDFFRTRRRETGMDLTDDCLKGNVT